MNPALGPAPPRAPPTVPGELRAGRSPVWPIVIGVLGIVFGLVILGSGVWALVGPDAIHVDHTTGSQAEFTARWMPFWIGAGCAQILGGVALVIACIVLFKRRPSSRVWLISAGVALILSGLAAAVTVTVQAYQGMTRSAVGTPGLNPAAFGIAMSGMIGFFSLLWYCTFPALLLWWLSRPIVRADFAAWAGRQDTSA